MPPQTRSQTRSQSRRVSRIFLGIPTELQQEVFEYLSIQDLKNATITCKDFRRIGFRQLFKDFRAFYFPDPIRSFQLSNVVQDYILEKHKFYASNQVARYVLSCTADDLDTFITYTAYSSILDSFFDILPHFINLKHLACGHLPFSRQRLSRLSALPVMDSVSFRSCHVSRDILTQYPFNPLPTFGTRSLFLSLHKPEAYLNPGHWPSVLDRKHLEDLSIEYSDAESFFVNDDDVLEPFPAVRSCSLSLPSNIMSLDLPIILRLLPHLNRLRLSVLGGEPAPFLQQPGDSIPPLIMFDGPYQCFPLVAAPSMRALRFSSSYSCDPNTLAGYLYRHANNHKLGNLEFIWMDPSYINARLFSAVCSLSFKLKVVRLEADRTVDSIGLLSTLPVDELPTSIEAFAMTWGDPSDSLKEADEEMSIFRKRLLARLPSLKVLWLMDEPYIGCLWERKGPDLAVTTIALFPTLASPQLSRRILNHFDIFNKDMLQR